MEFTQNQIDIFNYLNLLEEAHTFRSFLEKYLTFKKITYVFKPPEQPIELTVEGINCVKELFDILKVWNYLLILNFALDQNKLMQVNYPVYPLNIWISDKKRIDHTLSKMAMPLWGTLFYPSFVFDEYCKNNFKTAAEIEREINETRLNEERHERIKADKARRMANWLTILAVIISAILGLLNTFKAYSKDENIVRIKSFPDTVKVMYCNPPKDTLKMIVK